MYIEVTDADVREFKKLSGFEADDWHPTFTKKIISAAWEVMRKKHQDDLAEAVREAILQTKTSLVIEFCAFGDDCLVETANRRTGAIKCRTISLDDNFPTLAAAAVRDLSAQVKQ